MDLSQLLPLLVGGASGMLGGTTNPELTPEQQRVWKEWWENYQRQAGFSKSPNLSRSDELTDLANTQAYASQSAARNREGLWGGMSATDLGNPSVANQLANVGQAETAQQSRIYADASRTGLARRDAARNSLPSYLQGAAGIANNPGIPAQNTGVPPQLLQMFGQAWGARGQSNPYGASSPSTSPVSGSMGDPQLPPPAPVGGGGTMVNSVNGPSSYSSESGGRRPNFSADFSSDWELWENWERSKNRPRW